MSFLTTAIMKQNNHAAALVGKFYLAVVACGPAASIWERTMKDRYCEICGAFVGRMSDKAWEQMNRMCDLCDERRNLGYNPDDGDMCRSTGQDY